MSVSSVNRTLVCVLSFSMLWVGAPPMARAGLIGTGQAIELQERGALGSTAAAALARTEVRAQFLALGVHPDEVEARLAALADGELRILDARLAALPAGGVLEIVGIVFVVLILLELLGVTNVFTRL